MATDSALENLHFEDGDVSINVSSSRLYKLHSQTLRRCSTVLAGKLNEYPPAKLTAAARREGRTAYYLQLEKDSSENEDGLDDLDNLSKIGKFVRVRVSDSGKPQRNDDFVLISTNNWLGEIADKDKHWDWLFGLFYGIAPNFDDRSFDATSTDCMGLIFHAEKLDSIDHIREAVELALMRQDAVLWPAIATSPVFWANLGCRLHSPAILKEAVVHLVGKWRILIEPEKDQLLPEIRELCQKKWEELDRACEAIEIRILGHYPPKICRNSADKPERASYANDIYMWMVLCFFRHYFAQAIADGRTRLGSDEGFTFYSSVAQGGDQYLNHEDFYEFHKYFPMSHKACGVLKDNMYRLKEDIKPFVKDLMEVRIHVKPENDVQIAWLTCAVVNKEDLPWEAHDETEGGCEVAGRGESDMDVEEGIVAANIDLHETSAT